MSDKAGYGRENGQEKGWLGKIEPGSFRPDADAVEDRRAVIAKEGRAGEIKQEQSDEI